MDSHPSFTRKPVGGPIGLSRAFYVWTWAATAGLASVNVFGIYWSIRAHSAFTLVLNVFGIAFHIWNTRRFLRKMRRHFARLEEICNG